MRSAGFTLSELLIALLILGVIATFTIPKVLQSQQDSRNNAMAKEAAATFSNAYSAYLNQNGFSSAITSAHLEPYINYVAVDTVTTIDRNASNTVACPNAFARCLKLATGGMLRLIPGVSFGSTAATSAITISFDPDGVVSSVKGVEFRIYPNGLLKSCNTTLANTYDSSGGPYNPNTTCDPTWFSWN